MATLHAQPASTTPVFSDPSGRRALVFTWLARGLIVSFLLVTGAVAFTLLTQVPLPGLGGLVPHGSGSGSGEPRTSPARVADAGNDAARLFVPGGAATSSMAQADRTPVRSRVHTTAESATATAPGRPATAGTVATPAGQSSGQSGGQSSGQPGTPSGNANSQATTKTRNPQAAPRKPSPRVVREPDVHAATGRGHTTVTDDSATPPGQSK